MPSVAGTVGALSLPIAAGSANAELADPTVAGLMAYVAFVLKSDLDGKLAQMGGTTADACPTANRYPWDPSTHFVRCNFPALYMWWQGRSVVRPQTLVYDVRERKIECLYVFQELTAPSGLRSRAGLTAAVDASFAKAAERGRHPDYAPTGLPAGTDILTALSLLRWSYDGGESGFMAPIPNTSNSPGGPPEGGIQRGYPSVRGSFTVLEKIGPETLTDPEDVTPDILAEFETSDLYDLDNTTPILSRYLVAPDGSEDGDE